MNRLLIIGPSHYCEKARWGLDLAKIPYEVEGYPPFLHVRAVRKAGGQRPTPLLVAEGVPIDGSDAIMRWIQEQPDTRWKPYTEDPQQAARIRALEAEWGRKLGVLARLVGYHYVLPHKHLVMRAMANETSERSLRTFSRYFSVFRFLMRWSLGINEKKAETGLEALLTIFKEASEEADGEFFVGDQLTAADVTFAALGSLMVNPLEYGAPLPSVDELPEGARAMVKRFRALPAGQRILRLYETRRRVN